MASADLLILLSDIDGLYSAPPHLDPAAEFISSVPRITPAIEAMAGGAASELSRGGMHTKIEAAKIATTGGTHMIIADGARGSPAREDRGRRALHVVPDAGDAGHRAQEMDRRLARAARHDLRRRRRGARARLWPQPFAGRRRARARVEGIRSRAAIA